MCINQPHDMSTYQADLIQARELVKKWLTVSTDAKGTDWLKQKIVLLSEPVTLKDFYLAFGMAPRMVGKYPLPLGTDDLAVAQQLRKGDFAYLVTWMPACRTDRDLFSKKIMVAGAQVHGREPGNQDFAKRLANP